MGKLIKPTAQSKLLRQTLSQYPTGVAIVTALTSPGTPIGMTINSFASASLTPALITWCVDRNALAYRDFSKCNAFTITVLAENQQDIAHKFATKGADKFNNLSSIGNNIPPEIPNGSAVLFCKKQRNILLGDHLMLVGKVTEFGNHNRLPLVFSQGNFQQLFASRFKATA